MADYNLELIMHLPIQYAGVLFYAPTLADITQLGVEKYDKCFLPFALTPSCFENLQMSVFNAILHKSELLADLLNAMKIIIRYDAVKLYSNRIEFTFDNEDVQKEKSFVLDEQNFDDVSDIVLQINAMKHVEEEKAPICRNEQEMSSWEKLKAGRQRAAQKNRVNIYDLINVCLYGGNYAISKSEIIQMSLWELMNCYKAKMATKNYNDNLSVALVSGDGKLVSDNNHWFKQLMIR